MMTMKKSRYLFLLAAIGTGALYGDVMFKPLCYLGKFQLTAGFPKVMQEFTLTLSVEAYDTLPNTSVSLTVPEGVALLSGQQNQVLNLLPGDSVAIPYVLQTLDSGAFRIDALISPEQPDSFHWEEGTSFYVVSLTDTAYHSDTALADWVYNMEVSDTRPVVPKRLGNRLRVWGTIRYRDRDMSGDFVPIPDVEMCLVTGSSRRKVRTWQTTSAGQYNQTFDDLATGSYWLVILSRNSAAEVHGWPFSDPYQLAINQIVLTGNTEVEWNPNLAGSNPNGSYREDICQILVNVILSKAWALERFGYTLDRVNVKHPLPSYLGTCYVPKAWVIPDVVAIPGTDAVYIKDEDDIWGSWGKPTTSHEWGHAFMMKTFDDKVPLGLNWDWHWFYTVTNPGFAFGEGWAEFLGPAVWLDEYGSAVDEGTEKIEDYFPVRSDNAPWWRGPRFEDPPHYRNTDGRKVEGAVMQFFWDLLDDQATNDHTPGTDDEGLFNQCSEVGQAFLRVGEVGYSWSWEAPPEHPYIRGWIKRANIDVDVFKAKWDELCYPDVGELYSVVIHPFQYPEPYPVPAPSNLVCTYVPGHVGLTWTDNAANEGQYIIYRSIGAEPNYVLHDVLGPSATLYSDYLTIPGELHRYKVAALTCDTSEYASAEISVPPVSWVERPSMPATPSGKAVKDGGWLSFDPGSNLIYGAKGNKSADFSATTSMATPGTSLP